MVNERIKQIIPADNWDAIIERPEDGREHREPLICWALIEYSEGDDKWEDIEGCVHIDGHIAWVKSGFFEDYSLHFIRYAHTDQEV